MKELKKYTNAIAFLFSLVAFILLMATHGIVNGDIKANGIDLIFGDGMVWSGLLAWICLLLAVLVFGVATAADFVEIKALEKAKPLLPLCGACLLVLAALFAFIIVPTADITSIGSGWGIGAGWVIAGLLALCGGCFALLPRFVK